MGQPSTASTRVLVLLHLFVPNALVGSSTADFVTVVVLQEGILAVEAVAKAVVPAGELVAGMV